jgi:hypothetical protein
MCDLEKQSTNLPEATGPLDDNLTYSVTERGQRALAARLRLDAEGSARRRAAARAVRQQGRRWIRGLFSRGSSGVWAGHAASAPHRVPHLPPLAVVNRIQVPTPPDLLLAAGAPPAASTGCSKTVRTEPFPLGRRARSSGQGSLPVRS